LNVLDCAKKSNVFEQLKCAAENTGATGK
jgi:hypothetical protein